MDSSNDSSSGSTAMFAAPAIAESPDTQQSASSGVGHDHSHSSWKEVGHNVWSKDGEKKRSSSASLSTPRRSAKAVMNPLRKEKGRSKSPTVRQSSPRKTRHSGREWKRLRAIWLCYKNHMNVMTMAMLRAFRNCFGTASSSHPQKIRRTTSRSCSIHRFSTWEDRTI